MVVVRAGAAGGRDFFLDRTPVTNARYAAFVEETSAMAPSGWKGRRPPQGHEQEPVTGVRLEEARAFARWCGRRLPTETEWLRAWGDHRYPWGDEWRPDACLGPHDPRAARGPEAVGRATGASSCGCTDMLGNVWEWTEHDPGYAAPELGAAWVFGGSFRHRCDGGGPPRTGVNVENDYAYLGFRCAGDAS